MPVLALKLALAPAFVVLASLVARRFGPRVGGLVGGLPVVGGPILLVLAVVHDAPFAQRAATAALLGLISLAGFVFFYALVAARGWRAALLAAWVAFAAGTAVFALITAAVHVPPTVGLLAACASFVLVARAMPSGGGTGETAGPPAPPAWDLPVRALCAAAMVLAVTGVSSLVGARVAGLLAPAPIITSILAAFTQAQSAAPGASAGTFPVDAPGAAEGAAGAAPALALLRGMLTGFFAFAAFCFAVAVLLPHVAIGVAFAVAAAVSAGTSALVARA